MEMEIANKDIGFSWYLAKTIIEFPTINIYNGNVTHPVAMSSRNESNFQEFF